MHFHLPKPLHGWREFAGEVGIIVIGVLIALGAEQVVETLHWRNEVSAAKESISHEIDTQFFAASEMAIAQPCVDRQLQLLEDAVLAPGPFHPVPSYSDGAMTFAVRAPSRSWSDHIWQSISSDGTAPHLDRSTRLLLASFYGLVDYMRAKNATAETLRLKLGALRRPVEPDAAARANLVADIEQARGLYESMAIVADQVLGFGEAAGFRPQTVDLRAEGSGTLKFCRAHGLPLGKVKPQVPN